MGSSCARHPGRPAESACARCGSGICSACSVSAEAGIYCSPDCAASGDTFGPERGGEILVVPGTRRALVGGRCAVHEEIPALVLCARCTRRACAVCIVETPSGDYCSVACSEGTAPAQRGRRLVAAVLLVGAVAAAAFLAFRRPPEPPPVALVEQPAAEPVDAIEPQPLPPVVEEPRPEPPPPPVPEPPPPPPVRVELPKPVPSPPREVQGPAEEPIPPVDRRLAEALVRLREARPAFERLAEAYGSLGDGRTALDRFLAESARVEGLLLEAHAFYSEVVDQVPEPAVLRRRLGEIDSLLLALRIAADRASARLR